MKNALTGVAFTVATTLAAASASAQPLPTQTFPYKSGPVTITSCSVNEDKSNSTVSPNSLRINYFPNEEGRTLSSITFRVRYAGTPVTVTDTGNFAYNAPITHQFNQLGGHAWAGASPSVCRVVTASFTDGKVVNPEYNGPTGMRPASPGAQMAPQPDASGAPGATAVPSAGPTGS